MWAVEVLAQADKQIKSLDKQTSRRIIGYLEELATLEDPASKGKPLVGTLKGHWRYRVGDYRVICRIERKRITIVVVSLGHRSQVYKAS